ncbi:MAG: DUF6712 family protein [Prevotella koreensis]|uniref:DUF6712 family protein n=1 Tax=Prevotella koreensis TaxID=2490854 RepID=UPI003FA04F2B
MEIMNEITKEIFEKNVPAAKMPERNTSVYERMMTQFEVSYGNLIRDVISEECKDSIDRDNELKRLALRAVCIDAFVRSCRSLDLVLTSTGFGIVSTESTAPASRGRVDALVEEMTIEELDIVDSIVGRMIKVEHWGKTEQAARCISTLFYSPKFLRLYTTLPLTSQNWQFATGRAVTADTLLRNEISGEYMDELLSKIRTASLSNADITIVRTCRCFMGEFISRPENPKPNKLILQEIVEQLEKYPDYYTTYNNSELFRKRHGKRYENKREDPTFFFM